MAPAPPDMHPFKAQKMLHRTPPQASTTVKLSDLKKSPEQEVITESRRRRSGRNRRGISKDPEESKKLESLKRAVNERTQNEQGSGRGQSGSGSDTENEGRMEQNITNENLL